MHLPTPRAPVLPSSDPLPPQILDHCRTDVGGDLLRAELSASQPVHGRQNKMPAQDDQILSPEDASLAPNNTADQR